MLGRPVLGMMSNLSGLSSSLPGGARVGVLHICWSRRAGAQPRPRQNLKGQAMGHVWRQECRAQRHPGPPAEPPPGRPLAVSRPHLE